MEIMVAVITGGLALLGVVLSNRSSERRTQDSMQNSIRTAQAVTDVKLERLTEEVRAHNDFARRVPVVEEQMKVMNHRVGDLEEYHKGGNKL